MQPHADLSQTFVDACGIKVHARSWGAEDAEPVLLIHGASSDMGVFLPTVVPLLEKRFRVASYDRPGMGFTAMRPAGCERLQAQAHIAAGVIAAMGLKRPIVVGHSYGGSVALRLALDHPDKVSGLVLLAPVAYTWPGGVSWHLHWSSNPVVGGLFNRFVTRPFVDAAMRGGMTRAFAPSLAPEDYFNRASVMRAGRPQAMLANALDVTALKREIIAQQDRYPEIKAPVGILTGVGDTVVSPTIHSLTLSRALPDARLYLLQNVGHLPHEAAPARLVELIDWARGRRT